MIQVRTPRWGLLITPNMYRSQKNVKLNNLSHSGSVELTDGRFGSDTWGLWEYRERQSAEVLKLKSFKLFECGKNRLVLNHTFICIFMKSTQVV